MADTLIVYGSGGHAKVVIDAALAVAPATDIIVLDDEAEAVGKEVLGFRVAGGRSSLDSLPTEVPVALGIGANAPRWALMDLIRKKGRRMATIIHPSATLSDRSTVEEGAFIAAGAIVIVGATIRGGAIVNTAASVDHDCDIGEAAHIAPGARLCGNVSVGARSLIGVGSAVRPGISIGDDVVVGAGSAVVKDLPAKGRFVGCPARQIR